MSRPRLLDLYSGAGGAAMGYSRAGFEVVGVDIKPQPRYPFEFVQTDALQYAKLHAHEFDAIHASPPCQAFSTLRKLHPNRQYTQLIDETRNVIARKGKPYVMENVRGAPLRAVLILCGTMFPGLRVIRHRLFETNVLLFTPSHPQHPLVYTVDKRKNHYKALDENIAFVQVTGGGQCSVANARDAMGIDWMTKAELNEAIPPAYTEYIGEQLMWHLEAAA